MSDLRAVEVIFGQTGQIVECYPDEWQEGVPSSASVSVFDGMKGMDETAEFTASVTIDSVSTTVDVASGYSQTNKSRLYIASSASIATGRQYLAENVLANRELVTPRGIASNDYLDLEEDLQYDYPITTSTLKGMRMTFPVDDTWVAAEENLLTPEYPSYKAVWTYTQNSIVRRQYTYLDLVRQPFKHGVVLRDLNQYFPDLPYEQFIAQHGEAFRKIIHGAFKQLRVDIKRAGYRPSIIRDNEIINHLVILGSLLKIAQTGLSPGNRDIETYVNERKAEYDSLLAGTITAALKVEVDQSTQGGVTKPALQQLWFER
jgi:hypothetical protein